MSLRKRIRAASFEPRPYSARKVPAMTPTGVAITMPIPVRTRLPRMALAMPPPSDPGPGVGLVNRVGVKPRTPWTISITRIEPRTRAPTSVAPVQATRSVRSAMRRP